MTTFALIAVLAACSGTDDGDDTPTNDTVDPTDTVPTTDTGPRDPLLRAVHVAAGVPGQDMRGNGNPGRPPLVDLQFGQTWPAGGWATRPANTYTFTFTDHDTTEPWATFDFTLEDDEAYSLVIYGTADAPEVMALPEALDEVGTDATRIRWTHAAPTLGNLTLRDTVVKEPWADGQALAYGDTVEIDEPLGEVNLWLDLDGNDACDPGEAFAAFERDPGDHFHVLIAEDDAGDLFLQGHARDGSAPKRTVVDCP